MPLHAPKVFGRLDRDLDKRRPSEKCGKAGCEHDLEEDRYPTLSACGKINGLPVEARDAIKHTGDHAGGAG
jgi:hypothetical protein